MDRCCNTCQNNGTANCVFCDVTWFSEYDPLKDLNKLYALINEYSKRNMLLTDEIYKKDRIIHQLTTELESMKEEDDGIK